MSKLQKIVKTLLKASKYGLPEKTLIEKQINQGSETSKISNKEFAEKPSFFDNEIAIHNNPDTSNVDDDTKLPKKTQSNQKTSDQPNQLLCSMGEVLRVEIGKETIVHSGELRFCTVAVIAELDTDDNKLANWFIHHGSDAVKEMTECILNKKKENSTAVKYKLLYILTAPSTHFDQLLRTSTDNVSPDLTDSFDTSAEILDILRATFPDLNNLNKVKLQKGERVEKGERVGITTATFKISINGEVNIAKADESIHFDQKKLGYLGPPICYEIHKQGIRYFN